MGTGYVSRCKGTEAVGRWRHVYRELRNIGNKEKVMIKRIVRIKVIGFDDAFLW